MMRILFILLLLFHGLLHLMGVVKGMGWAEIKALTTPIAAWQGILWLLAALLLMGAAIALLTHNPLWWIPALLGIVVSQTLILSAWGDAKWGTVPNLIIAFPVVLAIFTAQFKAQYQLQVETGLHRIAALPEVAIRDGDLAHLPAPVQAYLRYAGVVGTPRVYHVFGAFEAQMRSKGEHWFTLSTEQHNFFDEPARLFWLSGKRKGLPVVGYHGYYDTTSFMVVKLGGLIPVVDQQHAALFKAETVTLLNDMCIFAPAALIDQQRLQWEAIDDQTCTVFFTNQGVTVAAKLHFNARNQLVNFVSHDRYDLSSGKPVEAIFSTPLKDYRELNGRQVAHYGEAMYTYADGEAFVYGRFTLRDLSYQY